MPHGNHLTKATAAAVAALLLFYWTLPDNPVEIVSATSAENQYRGVFHVHSVESDGGGTVEEIAAAARAANLDFVILTDHGDGTNSLPPRYIDEILIINGVEISTETGHYIAVGMRLAPYPLGGDAKGVVEDVQRLGGFGIIAHPYSPREELRWKDFTLPVDAIEWINGDSQWRGAGIVSVLSSSLHYWFRPVGSLNALLYRPTDALNMWDAVASNRPVVALPGLDAHARLATGNGDEGYTGGFLFRFPWYEDLFRVFGLRVNLDSAQTNDAVSDARNVISSIQSGRFYSSVESLAAPPDFTFLGTLADGTVVEMGDRIPSDQGLRLSAKVNGPTSGTVRLLQNGTTIAESTNLEVSYSVSDSDPTAVYRVEVYLSGSYANGDVPWVVSNPIFVGGRETENLLSAPTRGGYEPNPGGWHIEQHTDAQVALELNNDILTLAYTLGNSTATYAAIAYDVVPERIASEMSIDFVVRASKPMRVSAQLRRGAGEDSRWRHSFYADQRVRRIRLPVRDFSAVGALDSAGESMSGIDGLLFVADTVNYERNSSGELQISELRINEG